MSSKERTKLFNKGFSEEDVTDIDRVIGPGMTETEKKYALSEIGFDDAAIADILNIL